jgi:hypothetical protein
VSALLRKRPPAFPAAWLAFGLFLFALHFVGRSLALPRNISPTDPLRMSLLWSAALVGSVAAVVAFAVGAAVFARRWSRVVTWGLAGLIAVSIVGIISVNASRASYRRTGAADWRPTDGHKVVFVGLDRATWDLLDPLIAEGLLPNIERMRSKGIHANLVTHGRRLSAAVWTGIATGWSHAKHRVVGWTVPESGKATSRPVRSNDRRKPALWRILPEFGKSVVVLNWLVTSPSEATNGVIVSRVVDRDSPAVFPRAFSPAVAAVVESARAAAAPRGQFVAEIATVFDLAEFLLSKGQPDLLMIYVSATDKVQHRYWADHAPEKPRVRRLRAEGEPRPHVRSGANRALSGPILRAR